MDWKYRAERARLRLNHARRLGDALATTDGRWALVATTMSLLVAGSVTWMAIGTLPVSNPLVGTPSRTPIAYELFLKLVHTGGAGQFASYVQQYEGAGNADGTNAAPGVETRSITLDRGDTLAGALEDQGISATDANNAVAAIGKDFNPRAIKPGMTINLTYAVAPGSAANRKPKTTVVMVNRKPVTVPVDAQASNADAKPATAPAISRLLSLHFSPTIEQDITVTRTIDSGFAAKMVHKDLQVRYHRAGATIDSSLYLAGMQAGIPADIMVQMIHMFSYKVDFQRDLHPGDSFEVYYNYYYTPQGQPAKTGNIEYARLRLSGKDIRLYRFQPSPNAPAGYYDADGRSAKGMLMRTPVDGARISSGFGMRMHPILGYTRMHKGVDFAVPVGTPVMAAGTGTIIFMGRARGYGNFVLINHGNGYSTGYGHLSRFASGMHRGSHVRQGQVFAYSGDTGLSTGPHLHYEVRINNKQVNPLTVKVTQGKKLNGKELKAFLKHRIEIDAKVAAMPMQTKIADISADLRQAKDR